MEVPPAATSMMEGQAMTAVTAPVAPAVAAPLSGDGGDGSAAAAASPAPASSSDVEPVPVPVPVLARSNNTPAPANLLQLAQSAAWTEQQRLLEAARHRFDRVPPKDQPPSLRFDPSAPEAAPGVAPPPSVRFAAVGEAQAQAQAPQDYLPVQELNKYLPDREPQTPLKLVPPREDYDFPPLKPNLPFVTPDDVVTPPSGRDKQTIQAVFDKSLVPELLRNDQSANMFHQPVPQPPSEMNDVALDKELEQADMEGAKMIVPEGGPEEPAEEQSGEGEETEGEAEGETSDAQNNIPPEQPEAPRTNADNPLASSESINEANANIASETPSNSLGLLQLEQRQRQREGPAEEGAAEAEGQQVPGSRSGNYFPLEPVSPDTGVNRRRLKPIFGRGWYPSYQQHLQDLQNPDLYFKHLDRQFTEEGQAVRKRRAGKNFPRPRGGSMAPVLPQVPPSLPQNPPIQYQVSAEPYDPSVDINLADPKYDAHQWDEDATFMLQEDLRLPYIYTDGKPEEADGKALAPPDWATVDDVPEGPSPYRQEYRAAPRGAGRAFPSPDGYPYKIIKTSDPANAEALTEAAGRRRRRLLSVTPYVLDPIPTFPELPGENSQANAAAAVAASSSPNRAPGQPRPAAPDTRTRGSEFNPFAAAGQQGAAQTAEDESKSAAMLLEIEAAFPAEPGSQVKSSSSPAPADNGGHYLPDARPLVLPGGKQPSPNQSHGFAGPAVPAPVSSLLESSASVFPSSSSSSLSSGAAQPQSAEDEVRHVGREHQHPRSDAEDREVDWEEHGQRSMHHSSAHRYPHRSYPYGHRHDHDNRALETEFLERGSSSYHRRRQRAHRRHSSGSLQPELMPDAMGSAAASASVEPLLAHIPISNAQGALSLIHI